jgi:hypothetical protein
MSAAFVFLHVGPAAELPTLLVRSIRLFHENPEIVQCSDQTTLPVPGVTELRRFQGDTSNLMTFRLEAFAGLEWHGPALYLDTDMLCVAPIDPVGELLACDVAVCRRDFDRDAPFNARFGGLDLSEYEGRTLAQVYPYIACATATRDGRFWTECLTNLRGLDPKFHKWYGDQEAIRNVVESGRYSVGFLPESVYGFLPDAPRPTTPPRLLHFKGRQRKPFMFEVAKKLRIA